MTVQNNLNAAADLSVRVVEVATYPLLALVDFISARGYSEERYDARYNIRRLPEALVQGFFAKLSAAIEAVNRPGFNFLDLVEEKGSALASQISEAVRLQFANDNAEKPTGRKAA